MIITRVISPNKRKFIGNSPLDPIPAIKGVVLYMDGANTTKSSGNIWTDASNNGLTATGGGGVDDPSYSAGGWTLAGGDYFSLSKKVYCNHRAGFRIYGVIDRTSTGDDTLLGRDDLVAGDWNYIFFRGATNAFSIQGATAPTLNAAVGTDKCLVEINYDGAGNWVLYKDGVSIATSSVALTVSPAFKQIGRYATDTTDAFDGVIHSLVIYNGQNASDMASIRSTLQAKFIDATLAADVPYAAVSGTPITMLAKYGDSFTVGRSPDTELTGDYAYLTNPISGALIFDRLTSGSWVTYDAGTRYSSQMTAGDLGNECGFFDDASGRLAIVKYGIGGATFGVSGGAGKLLSKASADQYPLMLREIRLAHQDLKGQGYAVTWDKIFLDGGTNDAYDATDAGNVGTWLPQIQSDMDADFGDTFEYMCQEILTGSHLATVNSGFSSEAGTNVNFTYITSQDSSLTDLVHRTAPATVIQGRYMNTNWLGA